MNRGNKLWSVTIQRRETVRQVEVISELLLGYQHLTVILPQKRQISASQNLLISTSNEPGFGIPPSVALLAYLGLSPLAADVTPFSRSPATILYNIDMFESLQLSFFRVHKGFLVSFLSSYKQTKW